MISSFGANAAHRRGGGRGVGRRVSRLGDRFSRTSPTGRLRDRAAPDPAFHVAAVAIWLKLRGRPRATPAAAAVSARSPPPSRGCSGAPAPTSCRPARPRPRAPSRAARVHPAPLAARPRRRRSANTSARWSTTRRAPPAGRARGRMESGATRCMRSIRGRRATVALKAGLVFLIARRLLPPTCRASPFAMLAGVLLFLARVLRRVVHGAVVLAQVVSESSPSRCGGRSSVWDERPSAVARRCSRCGVAAFLSWPVWIGPLMVVLAGARGPAAAANSWSDSGCSTSRSPRSRSHRRGDSRAGASRRIPDGERGGFAIWPTPRVLGWPFIVLRPRVL